MSKRWITRLYHCSTVGAASLSLVPQDSWEKLVYGRTIYKNYDAVSFSTMYILFLFSSFVKVLVEKLLRSCPDVKAIYLLIRPKREREMAARLNELLNSPVS